MANSNATAVIIELLGDRGNVVRYTVADATAVAKGDLMTINNPRTVTVTAADNNPFAGIAVSEKVANDGAITIGCYTKGIFDLEQKTGVTGTAGEKCSIAGKNIISKVAAADLLFADVGIYLEDATAEEIIAVFVGGGN